MSPYSLGGLPQSLLCFEVTCYLIATAKYFIALICTFLLFYTYENLTNLIPHQNIAFQHNLNMQSQVMVTHIWSRIYYILFPLRQQLPFFVLIASICYQAFQMLYIQLCSKPGLYTQDNQKKKLMVSWIIAIYSSEPLD